MGSIHVGRGQYRVETSVLYVLRSVYCYCNGTVSYPLNSPATPCTVARTDDGAQQAARQFRAYYRDLSLLFALIRGTTFATREMF